MKTNDATEMFEVGFFEEQFENWKVKLVIVLIAIVALGVIGHYLL